jgi:nucleoside-diphosphate-sugar epimerase
VIHNAGLVRAPSFKQFLAVNRDGALRIAETVATTAPDAGFVLVSSLAATRPTISGYAASKAAAEIAVTEALANHRLSILRPPAIYGPFDAATKPLFDAMRWGVAPVLGAANAKFAMIYVDDAARAALAAGRAVNQSAPIFEIDDGADGHSWADVRSAGEAATGRRLRKISIPPSLIRILGGLGSLTSKLGLGAPFLTYGKAREMLVGDWLADQSRRPPNWSPEVSLQLGFSRTLACYRERR